MNSRQLVGSDLDGTVRVALKPFGWMRDYCRIPSLRKAGGIIAALTARRVNGHIRADVYITGSPVCEEPVTRFWLRCHGMRASLLSDPGRNRKLQKAGEHSSLQFKSEAIRKTGCTVFYEDELETVRELEKLTEAIVIHVH